MKTGLHVEIGVLAVFDKEVPQLFDYHMISIFGMNLVLLSLQDSCGDPVKRLTLIEKNIK
jgi:hypothetical protein